MINSFAVSISCNFLYHTGYVVGLHTVYLTWCLRLFSYWIMFSFYRTMVKWCILGRTGLTWTYRRPLGSEVWPLLTAPSMRTRQFDEHLASNNSSPITICIITLDPLFPCIQQLKLRHKLYNRLLIVPIGLFWHTPQLIYMLSVGLNEATKLSSYL